MKLFPSDIARQRVVEFLKEHGPATLEEITNGLPDELPARVKNAVQVLYYGSYVIAWRKKGNCYLYELRKAPPPFPFSPSAKPDKD